MFKKYISNIGYAIFLRTVLLLSNMPRDGIMVHYKQSHVQNSNNRNTELINTGTRFA